MTSKTGTNEGRNRRQRAFDIDISDPVWQHLERGVQIVLGVALVTGFTFLGESWGEANVPYRQLFPSIGNIGFAFIASLFITPVAAYIGMILRRTTSLPEYRINQIRSIGFNLLLIALIVVFYIEARDVIFALAEAQGLDPLDDASWE